MKQLDWGSLRPMRDTSSRCSLCGIVDFESSDLALRRNIEELDRSSENCSLCRFLFQCLSRLEPKPKASVKLVRDDASHAFRVSPDGPAVISIYADPDAEGDPPPYAKFGLPRLPDPASPQQFKLLKEWIRVCDQTHDCLKPRENSSRIVSMPTRLIDVNNAESSLCLIETDESVRYTYLALSHRWGKLKEEEKFCTCGKNIDNLMKEIPYAALPKNFQDAVRVTRRLGIKYLWIDSLCIIQDNQKDMAAEVGRMEDVFSHAYCTIAASSAASSLEGFLGERTQRYYVALQTSKGLVYLANAIDDFQKDAEDSVLGRRGWVFQERALSRRTIFFTSSQVYWECGKGICCETLAHLHNSERQFLGDSDFPKYGLQYYKDERIRLVQHLYRDYCALDLTEATDRSKAILGLQTRLGRTFKSGAHRGVLWEYFERTLLWQAEVPGGLSEIPYEKNDLKAVPSWSWMARNGKIQYMDIPFNGVNWTGRITRSDEEDRLLGEASHVSIDETELYNNTVLDSTEFKFDPGTWMCIVVGDMKTKRENEDVTHYVLLVRMESLDVLPHSYKRVGVGMLASAHIVPGTTSISLI